MKFPLFVYLTIIILTLLACDKNENTPEEDPIKLTPLEDVAQNKANIPTWIEKEDMLSRNGEKMGYGVILNPKSNNVLFFLDGGGACFNAFTCANNRDSFSEEDFINRVTSEKALIINRNSNKNQFRDWNVVFIPYATGDVHSGNNEMANIPGVPQNQVMTGRNNVSIVLHDVYNYFQTTGSNINEIVFSGSSAGGFGSFLNAHQLATVFGKDIKTTVIIDAGQVVMDTNVLTSCLEQQWLNYWNLDDGNPEDLNMFVTGSYAYDIQKIYEYLAKKYPKFNFGFLSYYEDEVNRGFYSFGQNDCPTLPSEIIEGSIFKQALIELKNDVLDNYSNWTIFYKNGTTHTFLNDPELDQTVNDVQLNQWISDLREGLATDTMD